MKIAYLLFLIVFLPFSTVANATKLKIENKEQAIQLVKSKYSGKILKVQANKINNHGGYKVKLITKKGVIYYISVDAQTGLISSK